jgi:hypothetical protein
MGKYYMQVIWVVNALGFAVKLSNDDGRNAWVGLVFHDRNAAFDFYLKFDEYFEKREKKNEEFKIDTNVDFSLKTGKKK